MNKHCRQQLEKFGMKVEDVTHVCIAPNFFPLLQYLLLMPEDIVRHHSYFFLVDTMPFSVISNIPCSTFRYGKDGFLNEIFKRIHKISLRFFKNLKFPFLKTAEIFAYDLPYLNLLIGKRTYSLLADAPNWVTLNLQSHSTEFQRQLQRTSSVKGRIQKIIYGDIFINYFGRNKQCSTVYLTEENVSPILEGKQVIINSLTQLWNESSVTKQDFIKCLYGISNEDIALLKSRPNIFFSQPLVNDCGLCEREYVDVLSKIFSNYPPRSIIIKTHPRDMFDYSQYFPDVVVFSKSISSQLLYLVGVIPHKIITITSTAIEGFPENIECDYYGGQIHPQLDSFFGKNYKPNRTVIYK